MSMVAMGGGEFLRRAELEDEWSKMHVFVSGGRRRLCLRAPPVFSKVITTHEAAASAQPRILDTDLNKDLKLLVGAFPQMLSDEQTIVSSEMISAQKVSEVLSRIISVKDGTNRDTAAPPVVSVVGRG